MRVSAPCAPRTRPSLHAPQRHPLQRCARRCCSEQRQRKDNNSLSTGASARASLDAHADAASQPASRQRPCAQPRSVCGSAVCSGPAAGEVAAREDTGTAARCVGPLEYNGVVGERLRQTAKATRKPVRRTTHFSYTSGTPHVRPPRASLGARVLRAAVHEQRHTHEQKARSR